MHKVRQGDRVNFKVEAVDGAAVRVTCARIWSNEQTQSGTRTARDHVTHADDFRRSNVSGRRAKKCRTDPVCGMKVTRQSKHHVAHAGADHFFCSAGCAAKFSADPAKYLETAPAPLSMARSRAPSTPARCIRRFARSGRATVRSAAWRSSPSMHRSPPTTPS